MIDTVLLIQPVKSVLLEAGFDVMQDIKHMMFVRANTEVRLSRGKTYVNMIYLHPWPEATSQRHFAIFRRNQRVEGIRLKCYRRWPSWIFNRKVNPEPQTSRMCTISCHCSSVVTRYLHGTRVETCNHSGHEVLQHEASNVP